MKKIFKKLIPNKLKEFAKKILDILDRKIIPINKPFILKDYLGVRFIFYPWNKGMVRTLLERKDLKKEVSAVKKFIKKGDLVFDVGSNIGILSAVYSCLVGNSGKVYSFEPVNETFSRLKETLALNGCDNAVPIKIALSDASGLADMQIFDESLSGLNSLAKPKYPAYNSSNVAVKTETLDNICAKLEITSIDFLKIDVEGFEKEVLAGANALLENNLIKFIQFEISDVPLSSSGKTPRDIVDFLKKYNYLVFSFDAAAKRFNGPISTIQQKKGGYDNFYSSQNDLSAIK